MLSLRLTRWIFGYVCFQVIGGSPERFYTNCARSGAYLWNIAPDEKAGACVAAGRYRYLRKNARRAGCRLRVRQRRGLPFRLKKIRAHPGLVAGTAAFLVICFSLSLRIWCVRVVGNETIPEETLLQALDTAGLSAGARRASADPQEIDRRLMLEFPQIRWASVNLRGSSAEVVLQETTAKPDIADQKTVCNVKAARTGQVLTLRVFEGTPEIRQGDAVTEGQLLVNAVVEDQMGGSRLVHASAEIIAETKREITVRVPFLKRTDTPTGRVLIRRNLDVFGAGIPLGLSRRPGADWKLSPEKTFVSLFGTELPLSIYTERWEEVRTEETLLSREQARTEAELEIAAEAEKQLEGIGRVTETKITETGDSDELICTAELTCEENIAKAAEISIK